MNRNVKDHSLDDLAMMPDDEFRALLRDSGLPNGETYLEQCFVYFRRFYGFPALDLARDAAHRGDTTAAMNALFGFVLDALSSDDQMHHQLTATRIKEAFSGRGKAGADARWADEEKEKQLAQALDEIEQMMKGKTKNPRWCHGEYIDHARGKYPALGPLDEKGKQRTRDGLSRGVKELAKQYGIRITGAKGRKE